MYLKLNIGETDGIWWIRIGLEETVSRINNGTIV